jgi:hypothetical protein
LSVNKYPKFHRLLTVLLQPQVHCEKSGNQPGKFSKKKTVYKNAIRPPKNVPSFEIVPRAKFAKSSWPLFFAAPGFKTRESTYIKDFLFVFHLLQNPTLIN